MRRKGRAWGAEAGRGCCAGAGGRRCGDGVPAVPADASTPFSSDHRRTMEEPKARHRFRCGRRSMRCRCSCRVRDEARQSDHDVVNILMATSVTIKPSDDGNQESKRQLEIERHVVGAVHGARLSIGSASTGMRAGVVAAPSCRVKSCCRRIRGRAML